MPVLSCLLLAAAAAGADIDAFEDFAGRLATSLHALVCTAGGIDPATGTEQTEYRRRRLARQKQLQRWYRDRGRDVSLADCKTDADRRNYREFRATMADAEFLRRRLRERQQFIAHMDRYAAALQTQIAGGLTGLMSAAAAGLPATAELERRLAERLQLDLHLRSRYFGRGAHTTIGALYVPDSRTVYLNLNWAVDAPDAFIDSLEHELWHHLLVRPVPGQLTANLWWEGFTELVAEQWRHVLDRQLPRDLRRRGRSVEYPVQVAFATLCFDAAPAATLISLAAPAPMRRLTDELRTGRAEGERRSLRLAIADALAASPRLPPARRQRIEELMHRWGWKEDDGSHFSLREYVDADGRFRDSRLQQALRFKKQLLRDLIQAVTVVNLEDIIARVPTRRLVLQTTVAPHLRRNLADVLDYVRDPFYQYANR